jgi:hypothetical protein
VCGVSFIVCTLLDEVSKIWEVVRKSLETR